MATIKDVAKSAGVSIATVSNYINRKKPVSREASRAIQAAIDELQYSQNLIARNFKTKRILISVLFCLTSMILIMFRYFRESNPTSKIRIIILILNFPGIFRNLRRILQKAF